MLLPKAGNYPPPWGLYPPRPHGIACVISVSAALAPKDGGNIYFSNKWDASLGDP